MKTGIHPEYKPTTIVCSCGNTIETRSTQEEIHVEICSVCHPFYTGRQKLVDTAGRVERFKRKYGDTGADQDVVEEAVEAGVEVGEPLEDEEADQEEEASDDEPSAPIPAAREETVSADRTDDHGSEETDEESAEDAGEAEKGEG